MFMFILTPCFGQSTNAYKGVTFTGVGVNFNQNTVRGLVGWYSPDGPFTVNTTGTNTVSQWNDVSPVGTNHLTMATKNIQPALTNTAFNVYNTVKFDGSNDRLDGNSLAQYATGNDVAYSIYLVCICTNASNTKVCMSFANSGNNTPTISHIPSDNTPKHRLLRTDDASTTIQLINPASSVAFSFHVYGCIFTGTTATNFFDRTMATGSVDTGAITLDSFSMGNSAKAAHSLPWEGSISEMLIFNRALSNDEDRTVRVNYLLQKYGP